MFPSLAERRAPHGTLPKDPTRLRIPRDFARETRRFVRSTLTERAFPTCGNGSSRRPGQGEARARGPVSQAFSRAEMPVSVNNLTTLIFLTRGRAPASPTCETNAAPPDWHGGQAEPCPTSPRFRRTSHETRAFRNDS